MREEIKQTVIVYLQGMIRKHRMNLELMLTNPVSVAEHPGFLETFESELEKVAHYEDMYTIATRL